MNCKLYFAVLLLVTTTIALTLSSHESISTDEDWVLAMQKCDGNSTWTLHGLWVTKMAVVMPTTD